jgi:hypothetical protein
LSAAPEEEVALVAAANSAVGAIQEGCTSSSNARKRRKRVAAATTAVGSAANCHKGQDVDMTSSEILQSEAGDDPLLQGFHFVALDDAQEHLLHQLAPAFVVLYDSNLAWIRMLECYQALHPQQPLQVHLLI